MTLYIIVSKQSGKTYGPFTAKQVLKWANKNLRVYTVTRLYKP